MGRIRSKQTFQSEKNRQCHHFQTKSNTVKHHITDYPAKQEENRVRSSNRTIHVVIQPPLYTVPKTYLRTRKGSGTWHRHLNIWFGNGFARSTNGTTAAIATAAAIATGWSSYGCGRWSNGWCHGRWWRRWCSGYRTSSGASTFRGQFWQ